MRIISLFPGATEIVAAVGAEHLLVGISHECDYPPTVRRLPRVTRTPIDPALSSGAIDKQVRRAVAEGRPVIKVDQARLAELRPDLIITQDLCEVCAVADGQVMRLAEALPSRPGIRTLSGRTLGGVEEDILAIGDLLDLADEAREVVVGMRDRLRRLRSQAPDPPPRVVLVEWLDPLYLAGHWVPDLVAAAGGTPVGVEAGAHSPTVGAGLIASLKPDLLLIALCGFDVERALTELERSPPADTGTPVWVLDGGAYTSRPGPRLPDGAARIQAAMHGLEMPGLSRWR